MNNKSGKELPQDYKPLKSWQFWFIAFTAALAAVDIFLQYNFDGGLFYSLTAFIFLMIFANEMFKQIKYHKSSLGIKYAVGFGVFYIVFDIFLYFIA
jgi:hypothetical protein